ncbi:START domain-containing protein [Paraglaciecola sp.]|uniref:START domain-containing protein n=1 Tax=Paraglaciecola sp. TaxID=1920173 RepID=UPI0032649CBC
MQCSTPKTMAYLILFICLSISPTSHADNWTLKKQKNNVSVYSQTTESGYSQILAITQIQVHPLALIALFDDIESTPKWVHNCSKVTILEKISTSERLVHSFFAAPWPIKDRDMVTYSNTTYSEGTVKIEISDRSTLILNHPKFVRMTNMHGVWKATPTSEGMTEISYQGGGNPGGRIPAFIANKELVSSIYNTFLNLNKILPSENYLPKNVTP